MIKFICAIFLVLICAVLSNGLIVAPILTVQSICGMFSNAAFSIPCAVLIVIFYFLKEIRFSMRYGRFRIWKTGIEISAQPSEYENDKIQDIWKKNNANYS